MDNYHYDFLIHSENESEASRHAGNLADNLNVLDGVIEAIRNKNETNTMDLGAVISVVAASGATLALAHGIADWLRARRGTKLELFFPEGSPSLKLVVNGIDPETALRIIERTVGTHKE